MMTPDDIDYLIGATTVFDDAWDYVKDMPYTPGPLLIADVLEAVRKVLLDYAEKEEVDE